LGPIGAGLVTTGVISWLFELPLDEASLEILKTLGVEEQISKVQRK
jgi:hypothetical protein